MKRDEKIAAISIATGCAGLLLFLFLTGAPKVLPPSAPVIPVDTTIVGDSSMVITYKIVEAAGVRP